MENLFKTDGEERLLKYGIKDEYGIIADKCRGGIGLLAVDTPDNQFSIQYNTEYKTVSVILNFFPDPRVRSFYMYQHACTPIKIATFPYMNLGDFIYKIDFGSECSYIINIEDNVCIISETISFNNQRIIAITINDNNTDLFCVDQIDEFNIHKEEYGYGIPTYNHKIYKISNGKTYQDLHPLRIIDLVTLYNSNGIILYSNVISNDPIYNYRSIRV